MHAVRYRQIMQSSQQTAETRETPEVTTRRALVVSGAGRYADPWHPFAATSVRISHILRDVGFAVEVSESVDDSLAALQSDASDVDLLVVNVGSPREPDAADAGSRAGLLAHLGRGGAVLSMHVSATSFPAIPEWEAIVGGIWVRGTTMHPDAGPARIKIYAERHAIVAPLHDFTVFDERYSYLRRPVFPCPNERMLDAVVFVRGNTGRRASFTMLSATTPARTSRRSTASLSGALRCGSWASCDGGRSQHPRFGRTDPCARYENRSPARRVGHQRTACRPNLITGARFNCRRARPTRERMRLARRAAGRPRSG